MSWFFFFGAVFAFYLTGMWITSYVIGRFTNWGGDGPGPVFGIIFWPILPVMLLIFGPFLLIGNLMNSSFQKGRFRRTGVKKKVREW